MYPNQTSKSKGAGSLGPKACNSHVSLHFQSLQINSTISTWELGVCTMERGELRWHYLMNHIHTPLDEQYKRDKPKKPWFKGFEKDLPLTTVTPDLNYSIKQIQYSQYMQCQGVTKWVVATLWIKKRNSFTIRTKPHMGRQFSGRQFFLISKQKRTQWVYNVSYLCL